MKGFIRKMKAELGSPVNYQLPVGNELFDLNSCLGKTLTLSFSGQVQCINCERPTKKSFSQGYCYPCFKKLAACDLCLMKPETCHYAAGTCREPAWGEANCMISHYVYLANSSGLKVGITRHTQVPTRWIDQGAIQALPIYKVNTRLDSGRLETTIGAMVADKTNWRTMLKGEVEILDMKARRDELLDRLKVSLQTLSDQGVGMERLEADVVEINYPVLEYPTKISSFNFDKNPLVEGTLMGIKGQYLIFDTGVINLRKFTAYDIEVQC